MFKKFKNIYISLAEFLKYLRGIYIYIVGKVGKKEKNPQNLYLLKNLRKSTITSLNIKLYYLTSKTSGKLAGEIPSLVKT